MGAFVLSIGARGGQRSSATSPSSGAGSSTSTSPFPSILRAAAARRGDRARREPAPHGAPHRRPTPTPSAPSPGPRTIRPGSRPGRRAARRAGRLFGIRRLPTATRTLRAEARRSRGRDLARALEPGGVAVLARVGAADAAPSSSHEDRLAAAEAVTSLLVERPRGRARSSSPARSQRPSSRRTASPSTRKRGRSSAACGSSPSSTSAETSWRCACAWMKPPMTPNGPEQPAVAEEHPGDDRVVGPAAGLDAPGDREAGAAVLEDDARPRRDDAEPKPSKRLWMNETAMPSPSTAQR